MQVILVPVLTVLLAILQLYRWVVIIWVVMSWLVQFNVINARNEIVRVIWSTLSQLVEPVLRPIRRRLPLFGALDLSPIVLFFIILLIELVIGELLIRIR